MVIVFTVVSVFGLLLMVVDWLLDHLGGRDAVDRALGGESDEVPGVVDTLADIDWSPSWDWSVEADRAA